MHPSQIVKLLYDHAATGAVYLSATDAVLDFTSREKAKKATIFICSSFGSHEIPLDGDWSARIFSKAFSNSLCCEGKKILVWNWKVIASFLLGMYGITIEFKGTLIDLKILESYTDTKLEKPKTMIEFMGRLKKVMSSENWSKTQKIYKSVHLPLALEVVPSLETIGILTTEKLHAFYDITGQENGRMLCYKALTRSFVPHVISPEQRELLKPLDFDSVFVYMDYKSMEVKMLGWLSGDEEINGLCDSEDIYRVAYEKILKTPCDSEDKRSLCKKIFLPVFYGMSAYGISEKFGLPIKVAEAIVDRIKNIFFKAYKWIEDYQKKAEIDKKVVDYCGKTRHFQDKSYRARNFAVQSPSAIYCLYQLIGLYKSLNGIGRIAYNVHDGYMIYANREKLKEVILASHKSLVSECNLFPNLSMSISCSVGRKITEMKTIKLPNRTKNEKSKESEKHLPIVSDNSIGI
jgi:hypothetical protein